MDTLLDPIALIKISSYTTRSQRDCLQVPRTRCRLEKHSTHGFPEPLEQPLRTAMLETITRLRYYARDTQVESISELLCICQNIWPVPVLV